MKAPSNMTTLTKLISITLVIGLAACSFKENREDLIVPIIDAAPTSSSNHDEKRHNQSGTKATYSYTVRSGDTLGTIAQQYLGSSDRYTELLALNNLKTNDAIFVGQLLKLPTQGLQIPSESTLTTRSSSISQQAEKEATEKYPELESLVQKEQYNQAIQWIMSQPELKTSNLLQLKLVTTTKQQIKVYQRQQRFSDAKTLLLGLTQDTRINANYQRELQHELSVLNAKQQLLTAKQYTDQSKYDDAYPILLNAWQEIGKPLEKNILFTNARNKVSEAYHQKALRLYRNQKLEEALAYWKKILAFNPNDDLALVYQDRVKALQNKLDNL